MMSNNTFHTDMHHDVVKGQTEFDLPVSFRLDTE